MNVPSEGSVHVKIGGRGRVFTGNPDVDELLFFYAGSIVMVTDDTFVEGKSFVSALFHDRKLLELIPSPVVDEPALREKALVNVDDLQELSISVNRLRKSIEPHQIIVHLYLPQVLVKHGSDAVLRLINFWMSEVRRAGHLEFFVIPKKTFVDFERKLMSIADGAIEISVEKTARGYETFFIPIRLSKDQFNLKPVKYTIENGKIIVKVSPAVDPHQTLAMLTPLLERGDEIKLFFTEKDDLEISPKYYLFFKETSGWRLSWISDAFGDELEKVMPLFAQLFDEGVLKLVSIPVSEEFLGEKMSEYGEKLRLVSSASFVSLFSVMLDYLKCRVDKEFEKREFIGCMSEMFARLYSYSVVSKERLSFERLMEKVLNTAFGCKAVVRQRSSDKFIVELKQCPVCGNPAWAEKEFFCKMVIGRVIAGASKVFFKSSVDVSEVQCGFGDKGNCVFAVRIVS
ncbi:MAG: hypothetical protein NZ581_03115 [Candidatus Caldarchaeum sp.]|nr:hypothetical protein [Candidatus Caldarchaeum sp.]MDW8435175.1 hypothetical protein [Candidatus Caldarchaeum sp.]